MSSIVLIFLIGYWSSTTSMDAPSGSKVVKILNLIIKVKPISYNLSHYSNYRILN